MTHFRAPCPLKYVFLYFYFDAYFSRHIFVTLPADKNPHFQGNPAKQTKTRQNDAWTQ